jgi:hypothetical protein
MEMREDGNMARNTGVCEARSIGHLEYVGTNTGIYGHQYRNTWVPI